MLSSGTCIMVNPVRKQKEQDKQSVTPYKHVERWSYTYFFVYFDSNTYFVYNIVTSVYLLYNVKCIFQILKKIDKRNIFFNDCLITLTINITLKAMTSVQ